MAMVVDSIGFSLPHASPASIPPSSSPLVIQTRLALPRCSDLRILVPSKLAPSHRTPPRVSRGIVCKQKKETIAPVGEVTDKTWKQLVLESDIPVLVDFWTTWCKPCRKIAPLVDELAKQYAGRIRCLKLNTDENPNTFTEYGIRKIPTVMIFKMGEKMDTVIGDVPKSTLTSTIEKYLDR